MERPAMNPNDRTPLDQANATIERLQAENKRMWDALVWIDGTLLCVTRTPIITKIHAKVIEGMCGTKPEPSPPPFLWDTVEPWAEYVAMEEDGSWWQYQGRPYIFGSGKIWFNQEGRYHIITPNPPPVADWRESLQMRPK